MKTDAKKTTPMPADKTADAESTLLQELLAKKNTGEESFAELATDERVLARISDGIYRQPSSALRELIANAYDADATQVLINTDAPRFDSISVKDNGHGMDEREVVRLIHHIGGSAKRLAIGADLGITSKDDPSRTPLGRRIIGKIGIGLFSVAQLGRRFQIITKRPGARHRIVADVQLRTYSEDTEPLGSSSKVHTGTVRLRSVKADDSKAHGTEIVIHDLNPAARDMLRSRDIWERADSTDPSLQETFSRPDFHIGRVNPKSPQILIEKPNLPWKKSDSPTRKFEALYESIGEALSNYGPKPSLETTLDRYLNTIWTLSLAAPLDYMDNVHPFDLTKEANLRFFLLSNDAGQPAEEIVLKGTQSVRTALSKKSIILESPGTRIPFEVNFDGVRLARPIRFTALPGVVADRPKTHPIMFIGQCAPPVAELDAEVRGGRRLRFETYFLWAPLILPREHVGIMLRIADNSGTLFDKTFLGYKISEVIRLSQITSELFVLEGLDAALNIDRESFNYGHTHSKIITGWVHRALRQVTNTQKRIASEFTKANQTQTSDQKRRKIEALVEAERKAQGEDDVREVHLLTDENEIPKKRRTGALVVNVDKVLPPVANKGVAAKTKRAVVESRLMALAQILDTYGLLEKLSYAKQQQLLNAIMRLFAEDV